MQVYIVTGRDIRVERNKREPIVSQCELAKTIGWSGTHLLSSLEKSATPLSDGIRTQVLNAFNTIDKKRREFHTRA